MRLKVKNIFGAGLIALAFSIGITKTAAAQSCTVPPTCDALGYTKTATDCKDMSTLKCPFDQSKVFCVTAAEVPGGNCEVGAILYSDKSCNVNVVAGKIAIGVVFDSTNNLAVALRDGGSKTWMPGYEDIPDLPNLTSTAIAIADWNGKNNTKAIINYCKANSKSCPAAEYANGFTTSGTAAGDWYLPALGELNAIYNGKAAINATMAKIGGTALTESYYWSSSEYGSNHAWLQALSDGKMGNYYKYSTYYVRPVLAF